MHRFMIWTLSALLILGAPLQAGEISLPEAGPFGVTVTPDGSKAYVPMFGTYYPYVVGTKVAVIDTATDTVTGTFTADMRPEDVAYTRGGEYAFITNSSSATVTIVHVATDTPVDSVSVGSPFATFAFGVAITPNGKEAYVCTSGGDYDGSEENIVVIDADPASPGFGTVTGTIEISGGFTRAGFRKDGKELVAPRGFPGNDFSASPQIATFGTKKKDLRRTVEVVPAPGAAHGIEDVAVTANGRYAYAPAFNWSGGSDELYVIDLVENKMSDIVVLGSGDAAQHGVAISPDGLLVGVTNYFAGTVSWIFTPTHTVIFESPVGVNPNEIGFTPDGRKAYVTNQGSGTVTVIALDSSADLVTGLVEGAIAAGKADAVASRDLSHWVAKVAGAKKDHLARRFLAHLVHRVRHWASAGKLTIGKDKVLFPGTADVNDVPTPTDTGGKDTVVDGFLSR